MSKFILVSGKVVDIPLATIEQALNLYQAVASECKHANLDLKIEDDTTVWQLLDKNTEALLNIVSSSTVLEAIKDCSTKVLYDKQHFSIQLFGKEDYRGDFFPVLELIALENLRPFFPMYHTVFNVISSRLLKS